MDGIVERIRELVFANRILAREGVVDAFGHISLRHPDNPERYFMSRSRAPGLITADDIMEFTLDGEAIDGRDRLPYGERPIHGGLYEMRPDVNSVVHNHACRAARLTVTARYMNDSHGPRWIASGMVDSHATGGYICDGDYVVTFWNPSPAGL